MNDILSGDLSTAKQREDYLIRIVGSLIRGEVKRGAVLRHLRKTLLKMNQAEFAIYANVSRRTLTEIENDSIGLNEDSLNRVFSVFGLRIGLVPVSEIHAKEITKNQQN